MHMNSKMKPFIKLAAASLCMAIPLTPLAAQNTSVSVGPTGQILSVHRFAASSQLAGSPTPAPKMSFYFMEGDAARDLLNSRLEFYDAGKYAQAESAFREVLRKYAKNKVADKS